MEESARYGSGTGTPTRRSVLAAVGAGAVAGVAGCLDTSAGVPTDTPAPSPTATPGPPPTGTRTPTDTPTPQVPGDVATAARTFEAAIADSGCPTALGGLAETGQVTTGNRDALRKRVLDGAWRLAVSNGDCTGAKPLTDAQRKQFAPVVDRTLAVGDDYALYVAGDRTTLVGDGPDGPYVLHPDQFLETTPVDAGLTLETDLPGSHWVAGSDSYVAIAEDLFGFDRVSKTYALKVTPEHDCSDADVDATTSASATLAQAKQATRVTDERRGDSWCAELEIQTYWSSPTGSFEVEAGEDGWSATITVSDIGSNGVHEEEIEVCVPCEHRHGATVEYQEGGQVFEWRYDAERDEWTSQGE